MLTMSLSAPMLRVRTLALCGVAVIALNGCDMLGIETPGMANAKKEAEGRAIGAACRHTVRSLEDCYGANPRVSKSAIFDGWREMDEYMRENEIQGMPAAPAGATPPVTAPEEVVLPSSNPQTATAQAAGSASASPPVPPASGAPTGAIQLPPRPTVAPPR